MIAEYNRWQKSPQNIGKQILEVEEFIDRFREENSLYLLSTSYTFYGILYIKETTEIYVADAHDDCFKQKEDLGKMLGLKSHHKLIPLRFNKLHTRKKNVSGKGVAAILILFATKYCDHKPMLFEKSDQKIVQEIIQKFKGLDYALRKSLSQAQSGVTIVPNLGLVNVHHATDRSCISFSENPAWAETPFESPPLALNALGVGPIFGHSPNGSRTCGRETTGRVAGRPSNHRYGWCYPPAPIFG